MRLRESEESVPKPLVRIGYLPILWHVMKYYAHFGHTDFILCLGYRADTIKSYFLNYNECISNDFVLSNGGKNLEFINRDVENWRITFVDTGINRSVGERLKAVQQYLQGEEVFLANYSDGLTDLYLPDLVDHFYKQGKVAMFLCVKPNLRYHFISANDGVVTELKDIGNADIRINAGYYVFRHAIFDHIRDGEDLVEGPFQRLIQQSQLAAYNYHGFWAAMDTFKDKQELEDVYIHGNAPWEVWKKPSARQIR